MIIHEIRLEGTTNEHFKIVFRPVDRLKLFNLVNFLLIYKKSTEVR